MGNLLLVEDDLTIRTSLQRVISKLCPGCEVLVAESGVQALEVLAENEVQLILSDHSMPEMSGLVLFAKTAELYPEIKRVLITAYPLQELNQEAVSSASLDGFIAKPFQIMEIKELLDELS